MREYELTVVYDLAVAEAGGPDASVEQLTHSVESRGGKVIRVDHWGRRRMAYPIGRIIDADYIVTRVELEPSDVAPLEAALRIDEKVLRHLVVRADELPVPMPPREPRQMAPAPADGEAPAATEAEAAPAVDAAADPVAAQPVAETPVAVAEPVAEAPAEEPVAEPIAEAPEAEAPAAEAPAAEGAPADEPAAEAAAEPTA